MTAAAAAVTLVLVGASADEVAPDQPPDSIGIRLVDVPDDRADDPRALASIVDHVAPGGRFTRRIDIVSTVDGPTDVGVYAGNAQVVDGAFRPDDRDRPGFADWVTLSATSVRLEPMSTHRIEVAVDVPTSAPLGEQFGYVWVEPPASAGDIAVTNRVGLRMYVSVGLGDEPPVDFVVGSMTASRDQGGVPSVSVRVRNTGGRVLDITGDLLLSEGPAGLSAGPFSFDRAVTLLPDEVGDATISLDPELPDGPWLATVTAVSGLLERTAEAEISFPSAAGQEAPPATSETIGGTDADGNDISEEIRNERRLLLPLAAIMILLAIGALYLMLMWKRREDDQDDEDDPVAAGVASTSGEDEGS